MNPRKIVYNSIFKRQLVVSYLKQLQIGQLFADSESHTLTKRKVNKS